MESYEYLILARDRKNNEEYISNLCAACITVYCSPEVNKQIVCTVALMQNRLVLTGIPSSIPRLPNAADALRDLVEEHGCWVDRFTFLSGENTDNSNATKVVAAAELHIENVRDRAVRSLDRLHVVLNCSGDIHWSGHSNNKGSSNDQLTSNECAAGNDAKTLLSFQIRAFPANLAQSKQLVERCRSLDSELEDVAAEKKMEKQTLKLPCDIELVVRRSNESGGTGTNPWRGGVILATQICLWFGGEDIKTDQDRAAGVIDFKSLFEKKTVLELGAGSASLPSMAVARICKQNNCDIDLISSDGVDETVTALKRNIAENQLDEYIRVKHIDWNDLTTFCKGEGDGNIKADTIIFSDCVYNEEGATALCNAICRILKTGGNVVGVLPDFRVGLDLFEKLMAVNHLFPVIIPLTEKQRKGSHKNDFTCSGGGGKNYRLLFWRDCRSKEG